MHTASCLLAQTAVPRVTQFRRCPVIFSPRLLVTIGLGHQTVVRRSVSKGRCFGNKHRLHYLPVKAVSAPDVSSPTYVKEFELKGCPYCVKVAVDDGSAQSVQLWTDLPGKLLLHWGVEGGAGYKGGWRLPAPEFRPEGTVQYKDRALQTPFTPVQGGQQVVLRFSGPEVSDYLNFVLKDVSTNTWYDCNGDNFKVRLHAKAPPPPAPAQLLPDDQLPDLPQELCGIWAYIKWEVAGCPNRSQQEADQEYQAAIAELKQFLRQSIPLEELWRVARGEGTKYQEWLKQQQVKTKVAVVQPAAPPPKAQAPAAPAAPPKQAKVAVVQPPPAPPAPPKEVLPQIPESLVAVVAYILWEKAGKPQGADFGNAAKEEIINDLRKGIKLEDIEAKVRAPAPAKPPPPAPAAKPVAKAAPSVPVAARAPSPPATPTIGPSVMNGGVIYARPLEFVKTSRPLLSSDKKHEPTKPLTPLANAAKADQSVLWQRTFPLGSKAELLATVQKEGGSQDRWKVVLTSDAADPVVLHWGVKKGTKADWMLPPTELVPNGSKEHEGGIAYDTPFGECEDEECDVEALDAKVPLQRVTFHVPSGLDVSALTFVLRSQDCTRWWRDGGSNFTVPLPSSKAEEDDFSGDPLARFSDPLSRTIVDCEVNYSMWTLMHRFNKAADLLGEVLQGFYDDVADSMARIFVWLRYSALRQLTWQRNYNTQPRILGAAQARLTHLIAKAYADTGGEAQEWVRYMLTCVGRGGNAQAVRDEILNIMHRHHIPEKKGTWMEQWHQKLHNNTTPDDVVICKAYLQFLEEDGNQDAYYRVLKEGGVTRERLASFERPITLDAEYFPGKAEALIKEFRNYLGILESVHSGAELQSSAAAAAPFLPNEAKGALGYILANRGGNEILPLMQNAVACRTALVPVCQQGNREVLYLDLALESLVRMTAERAAGASGMGAAPLVAPLLANLVLSRGDNEELCYCLKAWEDLPAYCRTGANPSQEDALKMIAVLERIRRALASASDAISERIGPIASSFGRAFKVDAWAVDIFAEEVVRSGPAFAVSLILSSLDPALRSAAQLSSWQVISPGDVRGRVVVVGGLHEVQDKSYDGQTVLVAMRVTGEEEVPEGVVALISPDAPDVLAHLSVRARNMKVLFAACYDEKPIQEIAALKGRVINISTTAGGKVQWEDVSLGRSSSKVFDIAENPAYLPRSKIVISIPTWCGKLVVRMDEYKDGIVGAKSKNLAGLRGKLPDWINLPASCTVPFSTFEEVVLRMKENLSIAAAVEEKVATVNLENAERVLSQCRELVMRVRVPDALVDDLKVAMEAVGIPVPQTRERWDQALTALKGVWASKYNERAYISMRKVGLDFMGIRMAVLVQRVVPAKYAYVIHTRNPVTGAADEIYCEMVMGLGEAIVSGMVPGSALAFVAKKNDLDNPKVLLYPSKSDGMYVRESLIFRSDSNGEDLEGYAGAGLYDSITMDPTLLKRVEYNEDRLLQDEAYKRSIMSQICKVGYAIEEALGSAQDVEGVVGLDDAITVVQTRPQM